MQTIKVLISLLSFCLIEFFILGICLNVNEPTIFPTITFAIVLMWYLWYCTLSSLLNDYDEINEVHRLSKESQKCHCFDSHISKTVDSEHLKCHCFRGHNNESVDSESHKCPWVNNHIKNRTKLYTSEVEVSDSEDETIKPLSKMFENNNDVIVRKKDWDAIMTNIDVMTNIITESQRERKESDGYTHEEESDAE